MVTCRNGACAERHPGRGAAERDHPPGMLRGQHREHDQQPAVHLARLELSGGRARDTDALAVQQLRARGPARGQVGRYGPLVGGGPARGSGADLDQAGPGPEAGQQHRRALLPGGRSGRDERPPTSAPAAPGATGTSRLAATPCARSAAHMSGSHPTVSALLSWLATQVAACVRTVPAAPRAQAGGTALRTGRRSRPGRRPADLDDAHHRRGRDHHADGQDQRQPRMPQPGHPAPGPQADGRRQHPAP